MPYRYILVEPLIYNLQMISHDDISSDNNITVIFRVSFKWKLSCVFRFTNNTVLCDLQHKKRK